jgi:hypothetical protein
VLAHPQYYAARRQVIDFLEHHARQSRPSALDSVLHGATKGTKAGSHKGHEDD